MSYFPLTRLSGVAKHLKMDYFLEIILRQNKHTLREVARDFLKYEVGDGKKKKKNCGMIIGILLGLLFSRTKNGSGNLLDQRIWSLFTATFFLLILKWKIELFGLLSNLVSLFVLLLGMHCEAKGPKFISVGLFGLIKIFQDMLLLSDWLFKTSFQL